MSVQTTVFMILNNPRNIKPIITKGSNIVAMAMIRPRAVPRIPIVRPINPATNPIAKPKTSQPTVIKSTPDNITNSAVFIIYLLPLRFI